MCIVKPFDDNGKQPHLKKRSIDVQYPSDTLNSSEEENHKKKSSSTTDNNHNHECVDIYSELEKQKLLKVIDPIIASFNIGDFDEVPTTIMTTILK